MDAEFLGAAAHEDGHEQTVRDRLAQKPLDLFLCKRFSLEMASTFGWGRYAKYSIGVDSFGASGKMADVLSEYGFTASKVADRIAYWLGRK